MRAYAFLGPIMAVLFGAMASQEDNLVARGSFEKVGTVVAPVVYEHIGFSINWTAVEDDMQRAFEAIDRQFAIWADKVEASEASQEYKRMRVTFVRHLIEEEKHDAEQAVQEMIDVLWDGEPRDERSLLGDIAGVVGLGSGLYSSFEVNQLRKQVQANRMEVEKSRLVEKRLKKALQVWMNQLSNEKSDVEFGRILRKEFRAFTRHVQDTVGTVISASANQLHSSVFYDRDLKTLLRNVTDQLDLKGFRTVDKGIDALAMAKVSHVREKGAISVLIHVPIVQKKVAELPLYRMLPAEVSKEGTVLSFSSLKRFIAVDGEDGEHMVFSEEDLNACDRRHTQHRCVGARLRFRSPQTCVAAMYFRRPEDVIHWCEHKWEKQTGTTMEVAPGVLSVEPGTQVNVACPGRPLEQVEEPLVKVPPNCSAAADGFRVLAAEDVGTVLTKVFRNFTIVPEELGPGGASYFETVRLSMNSYKVPPVAAMPKQLANMWSIVLAVGLTALVVGLAICGYIAFRLYRHLCNGTQKEIGDPKGEVVQSHPTLEEREREYSETLQWAVAPDDSEPGRQSSRMDPTLLVERLQEERAKRLAKTIAQVAIEL